MPGASGHRLAYIDTMKFRVLLSFLFAALLAVLASAQTPSDTEKHDAENRDPLYFVKIATDVAGNLQGHSMKGSIAIYIDQKTWKGGLEDGDLGPFIKLKEAKPGRSVACLSSQKKDFLTCVYFDYGTPFGVASVQAGASGSIDASTVPGAYKDISKDLLKKRDDDLYFKSLTISSDNGEPLVAYMITSASKAKSDAGAAK
jgi:hypothetical protein